MAESVVKITLQADGSIKTDARGVSGSEGEIMKLLGELAGAVGGELRIEAHEAGVKHHHHHSGGVTHRH